MSVTSFKQALETRMESIAQKAVGISSGLSPYVKTFDDHLENVELSALPYWVGFTLSTEREQIEIGSKYGNWIWHCQMYYMDTTQAGESWDVGKDRRDTLVGALTDAFEGNHFMADSTGALVDIDAKNVKESVWQVDVNNVTFDQTGQDGYYTFVSEIFLDVHTNKS